MDSAPPSACWTCLSGRDLPGPLLYTPRIPALTDSPTPRLRAAPSLCSRHPRIDAAAHVGPRPLSPPPSLSLLLNLAQAWRYNVPTMRKLIHTLLISLLVVGTLSFGSVSLADVWVNSYYRSDGTFVQGHYRTAPNRYKYDNYSTWGNTNPYTGERGYRYKRQCRYNSFC